MFKVIYLVAIYVHTFAYPCNFVSLGHIIQPVCKPYIWLSAEIDKEGLGLLIKLK